jgi:hypothetical protein
MLGCIDGHRPRQPTRPSLERRIEEAGLTRRMPQSARTLTRRGSQQNVVAVGSDAQPNGVRLSCGATLCCSQTECYRRNRGAGSFRRVLGGYARKSPQVLKTGGWPPSPSNRSWSISWRTVK